ncbi:aspartate--ammonia ligase [Helcococcus kunzii]|uniref:aspartate--ammonia ligase n=1 Tax=Helcococcus kunzii TaxID=40091 RepID=UPI0021A91955|nr:aspartate--ammonia ligase [Helcococcus kunzii]MCT1795741.1 aspartate--ammonia ligase [Helcococcus kunzii]MCT1989578.1 aspartate--ammonia ligase [Helcococcus kunzii]
MSKLYIPKGYQSSLDLAQTQYFIKEIKEVFQYTLARSLDLLRVSAPMFVRTTTGINDNLSGVEKPVSFKVKENNSEANVEIVHSLAKWKRFALGRYKIPTYKGIYADMNAIRAFEEFDNTHSIYVDQWDWERVILEKDRTEDYLKETVNTIYEALLHLEEHLRIKINDYKKLLPERISFIKSQELEDMYPNLSPEEREKSYAKEKGAIFVMQIGDTLKSGTRHGDRSPDYDDWKLNGDLIVWNPILDDALELSSMGIRVTPEILMEQLTKSNSLDRVHQDYHKKLLNNELPLTIGGGIGQSRLCMFFLQKAHIGEVQVSIWPQEVMDECEENGIILL